MRLKKLLAGTLAVMTIAGGTVTMDGVNVFAEGETAVAQTGWQADGTYLLNGVKQYGAITVDGHNYYLDDTTGVKKVNAWVNNAYYDGNGVRFESGAHTVDHQNYYFKDGEKQTSLWVGKAYYDSEGKRLDHGKYTIDGVNYYFEKGKKQVSTWIENSYYDENGQRVENGTYVIDGSTYYFKDGVKQVNKTIDGHYYDENGKQVTGGYATISHKKVYFDENGALANGVIKVNKTYTYFVKGVVRKQSGWLKNNKKYYYLKKGKAQTGLRKINGKTYYFSNQASLATGFQTVNKKKYYFVTSGKIGKIDAAKTGLFKVGKGTYYANRNGVLTTSKTIKIGNKYYTFNAKGKATLIRVADALSGTDAKAQKYSSPTKYLILVNRSAHRVTVYTGAKNNWKRKKSFLCGNGKSSTPTISGVFHTGTTPGRYAKARYFDSGSARCWYATRITGGYLFHSVLYTQSSSPTTVKDGRVGVGVSHGCIRLKLQNAKWIYDNIPRTTTVVIY